jgi:hypothetical protein
MKKHVAVLSAVAATVAALVWSPSAFPQAPEVLVDDTTPGHYNAALGTALDETQAQFPCADVLCGDPTISPAPEPDLSTVSATLGDWLASPRSLNTSWSGAQTIPLAWDLNTETAIVYEIDAGRCGAENVSGSFGVDNGIFVWVNGVYKFGALAPGPAIPGEYSIDLGNLPPGPNFVQILREDHGRESDYSVEITGTLADCPGGDGNGDGDGGEDGDGDGNGNGDGGEDGNGGEDDGNKANANEEDKG